jgi:hypothetical protein
MTKTPITVHIHGAIAVTSPTPESAPVTVEHQTYRDEPVDKPDSVPGERMTGGDTP